MIWTIKSTSRLQANHTSIRWHSKSFWLRQRNKSTQKYLMCYFHCVQYSQLTRYAIHKHCLVFLSAKSNRHTIYAQNFIPNSNSKFVELFVAIHLCNFPSTKINPDSPVIIFVSYHTQVNFVRLNKKTLRYIIPLSKVIGVQKTCKLGIFVILVIIKPKQKIS